MKRIVFLFLIYFVSLQNSIASTLPPGTNISSNLTIDQTWINSNPGPWLISGSNITLTFGANLTISNTNQYFEITGSDITINGANKIITLLLMDLLISMDYLTHQMQMLQVQK